MTAIKIRTRPERQHQPVEVLQKVDEGGEPQQRPERGNVRPQFAAVAAHQARGAHMVVVVGKELQRQPAGKRDAQPQQYDAGADLPADRAQQLGPVQRERQQDEAQDGQRHLPQRNREGQGAAGRLAGPGVSDVGQAFHHPAAAQQQQGGQADDEDEFRRPLDREGAPRVVPQRHLDLFAHRLAQLDQVLDGLGPGGGVEGRRAPRQQLSRLALAQARVDLADQAVGAGVGGLRGAARGLDLVQFGGEARPQAGKLGLLFSALLGRGSERVDLVAQRGDARGVDVLRREQAAALVGQRGPELGQALIRDVGGLEDILGLEREFAPLPVDRR